MKRLFLTINKKWIVGFIILALVIFLLVRLFAVSSASVPKSDYTIVIDAGHGGDDGGAVGKNGTTESYLNLIYSQELERLCKSAGINVIMTRTDMNGLYSATASNKKRSEMEKRESIINSSDADLVISIHMNSFPLPSCRGAQAFYKIGSDESKALADSIQASFVQDVPSARESSSAGDYYVLNCTEKVGVLIECGYLSNEEEEQNLCDEEYRINFCKSLLRGILNFYKA